ncbi:PEP-CTERM sorting domain-containing protein [Desulfobacca acetoxidans]
MGKKKLMLTLLVAALTLVLSSGLALAFQQTFFGEDLGLGEGTPLSSWPNAAAARSSFLSNLVGVGTENFESYADGTGAPLAITFPGAGTATLSGTGYVNSVTPGTTNGVGRYATSGSNYWEGSGTFYIEFDSPVAALGFYGIDIGDFSGQVTLKTENGVTTNYTIPNTVNGKGGSVLFYGVIDTDNPFITATFGNTASGTDYFGFDDMTIGSVEQVQPAPVPGALMLLGTGLLGLLGLRRFSRN